MHATCLGIIMVITAHDAPASGPFAPSRRAHAAASLHASARLAPTPAPLRARWLGAVVALALLLPIDLAGEPVITEFMASNAATLADEDGTYSDWVEINNPDGVALNLGGWYLTDTATNKTKWQFPAVSLPAGGYLIVWASNKNRRDPAKPLHTNFALSSGGEYLGLIKPDGATVASDFAPTYPPQRDDVSYGIAQVAGKNPQIGYFSTPTPGRVNGTQASANALNETVVFSRASGPFKEPFTLELSGAGPGQRIRYISVAPSVAGFTGPDPTATSPEYVRPLTITGSRAIRAAVFSSDGGVRGPVSVAHFAHVAAATAGFASQLPVLVLDNHGFGALVKDGIDRPSWMYAYAVRDAKAAVFDSAPTVSTPLTMAVRGQTAAEFPKKSYNLKFTDERGAKHAQSFFGSAAFEKWALISPWYFDPTFMSNALAYALSNRIGRWAPRTQFAEVFFNNGAELDSAAYYGVGVVTDRVEVGESRVAITPLTAADVGVTAVTGGYIVKIDTRDDDEFGFKTDRELPEDADTMVVVAYPKDADLAPAQRAYIRTYVQAMEDTLFADQAGGWNSRAYLDYIDRASWVDHHILNTLAANPDAMRRSAYFHKDRNGRLVAGPLWDFDRAFNSPDSRNVGPEGWRGEIPGNDSVWNVGWWRVLSRDPEFLQEWIDRWQTLRQSEFKDENLTALVEALARMIGRDAAGRDAARWPDNASRFANYDGEIDRLKTWLTSRAGWIDRQWLPAPTVVAQGAMLLLTPAPGATLAYTLDGSDPRSVGGSLAPNALLSLQAIQVPANANLHARSYDRSGATEFPRTPWSSVVGGTSSTPLSPAARIVNISARSVIGAGDSALVTTVLVSDCNSKQLLSRGTGPGLAAFAQSGMLPDPQLTLVTIAGQPIAFNAGWDSGVDGAQLPQVFQSVGAFPFARGSADCAALTAVNRGAYILALTSPTGREGLGLVELFELDGNGRSLNASVRGFVGTDTAVLIAGFVVQGPASKRVLVRASSAAPGMNTPGNQLREPVLTLYSGATAIATNERWSSAPNAPQIETAARALGVFTTPGGPNEDAAILVTVPPGAYTAVVHGKNGTRGVALLAVQEVP